MRYARNRWYGEESQGGSQRSSGVRLAFDINAQNIEVNRQSLLRIRLGGIVTMESKCLVSSSQAGALRDDPFLNAST